MSASCGCTVLMLWCPLVLLCGTMESCWQNLSPRYDFCFRQHLLCLLLCIILKLLILLSMMTLDRMIGGYFWCSASLVPLLATATTFRYQPQRPSSAGALSSSTILLEKPNQLWKAPLSDKGSCLKILIIYKIPYFAGVWLWFGQQFGPPPTITNLVSKL